MGVFDLKMLYLISGRSATHWNIGRKIQEVTKSFLLYCEVDLICGGDLQGGKGYNNLEHKIESIGDYHQKWYRRNKLMRFFVISYSELKDIVHSLITYRVIKKRNIAYGLVWERSSRLHWAGILYAKRHSIPCVLEWKDHLIDYKYSLFKPIAVFVENWKNKNADFISVESKKIKHILISQGIDEKKIYVTYNAVNPNEFSKNIQLGLSIRKQLGIDNSVLLVGYVGSYAFYHDTIRIIKAAKLLKDRNDVNIKWLLIGDGKDRKECEKSAIELGLLNKEIFMLPFQSKEKIPGFLSAMDVTILPGSTDIICPIKVMEYMAAKSVVLVPNYECNREIIQDGYNGLLFTPYDENSIVSQLIKISSNKQLCEQLGENARQTVLKKLVWDKTYGAVLKEIICKIITPKNDENNN